MLAISLLTAIMSFVMLSVGFFDFSIVLLFVSALSFVAGIHRILLSRGGDW